jgi:hypothetical protein
MFSLKTMKRYLIEKMCKVLHVGQLLSMESQSVSDRKQRVVLVKEKNNFILSQNNVTPRMTVELASLGSKVSRITVAKYMNQLGLK